MAMELIIYPDVEAGINTILENDPNIQAFNPVTVSSTYIGYTNGASWVNSYRRGGIPVWPMPDEANMFFNVLAATRETCSLLARTVHGVVHAHRGDTIGSRGNGMIITNVINSSGMIWLPDPAGYPRYSFGIQISARPI